MRLTAKLAAAYVIIALIPLGVLGYLSYVSAKQALEKQALEDLTLIAEAKEGHLYSFLEAIKGRTVDFSFDGFIRDSAGALQSLEPDSPRYIVMQKALNAHLRHDKMPLDNSMQLILILDVKGKVIAATDGRYIGSDESANEYFIQGRKGPYISSFYTQPMKDGKKRHLAVSAPLTGRKSGTPLGVIVDFYGLDEFDKILSGKFQVEKGAPSGGSRRRETLDIYLVNKEKLLITPSRFSGEVMKQKVENLPVKECAAGREISRVYNHAGREVLGASMCISSLGWTLITEMGTEEALAPAATMREKSLLLGIAVVFFAFSFYFILMRWITNPIGRLLEASRAISKGDLTHEIKVSVRDELGELAESYRVMIRSLGALVLKIQKVADSIASTSQEVAASSEEINATTEQVARTIQEISHATQVQAEQTKSAREEMNTISAAFRHITGKVESAMVISNKANQAALSGSQSAKKGIEQIGEIKDVVYSSANAVKGLEVSSQHIGEIVGVITSLADQTNLLALNAAIEAARAGKYGRGFAVVAEEVRKLAEGTAQAAEEITRLIKDIQDKTSKAIETMEEVNLKVSEGSDVVAKALSALEEITEVINDTATEIEMVAATAEGQVAATESSVKLIAGIASETEKTASSTEELSAAAEEQTASMEGLSSSAQELAYLAQQLQNAVSSFIVGATPGTEAPEREEEEFKGPGMKKSLSPRVKMHELTANGGIKQHKGQVR
jgi:methyl-accepting chemotaxis protein